MSDEPMIDALQALTGLSIEEALRLEVKMLRARAVFAEEQCYKAWELRRQTLRDMDALMGVECSLVHTHADGPSCGRCGTRPNGEVG